MFVSSLILGLIWCVWHIPLFFIIDTWQQSFILKDPLLVIYFFVGLLINSFILTWIFYKNNRSILSAIIYHFIVNLFGNIFDYQTVESKMIELCLLSITVMVIIYLDRDFFLSKKYY